MSDGTNTSGSERLMSDVKDYVNYCVKDYAGRVDDTVIASILRDIADSYDPASDAEYLLERINEAFDEPESGQRIQYCVECDEIHHGKYVELENNGKVTFNCCHSTDHTRLVSHWEDTSLIGAKEVLETVVDGRDAGE